MTRCDQPKRLRILSLPSGAIVNQAGSLSPRIFMLRTQDNMLPRARFALLPSNFSSRFSTHSKAVEQRYARRAVSTFNAEKCKPDSAKAKERSRISARSHNPAIILQVGHRLCRAAPQSCHVPPFVDGTVTCRRQKYRMKTAFSGKSALVFVLKEVLAQGGMRPASCKYE